MAALLSPLPVEILNGSEFFYSDLESFVDDSSTDSWTHDDLLDMATTSPAQTLCDSLSGGDIDDSVSMYDKQELIKEERKETAMEEDLGISDKSFLDLPLQNSFLLDSYNQDYGRQSDSDSFKSWTEKHPDSWSSSEVKDWIFSVAAEHGLDFSRVHTENFSTVTGLHLSRFELQDFLERDPDYGELYFSIFSELSNGVRFIPPANVDHVGETNEVTYNVPSEEILNGLVAQTQSDMETDAETSRMLDNNLQTLMVCRKGVIKVNINDHWYDIDSNIDVCPNSDNYSHDLGYESGDSGDSPTHVASVPSDLFSDEDDHSLSSSKPTSPKKKNSSRRINSSSSDSGVEEDVKSNRGRKPGQSSKGNHLWEFIRDLLKDSSYNPSLLRWEDKETGVFRFVQSEAVAQMWGKKKNNPGMTYEKLSRAMRFCRTAGYFAGVPKTGKYPKKLCFRFGPKSFGWETV